MNLAGNIKHTSVKISDRVFQHLLDSLSCQPPQSTKITASDSALDQIKKTRPEKTEFAHIKIYSTAEMALQEFVGLSPGATQNTELASNRNLSAIENIAVESTDVLPLKVSGAFRKSQDLERPGFYMGVEEINNLDTSPRLLPGHFVVPYFQSSKNSLPITLLKDIKSQKCGLRHTIFSPSGSEYTGEWLDNKKHGSGTQVWKKTGAIYDGKWKSGKPDGFGTYSVLLQKSKGYTKKYSGEWKSGKKHGYGTYFYNSSVYEGEWSENKRSGWGRMYYENGDIYEGEWLEDKNHGQGVMRFSNGNWYEGNWQDGKRSGDGRFCYANKGLIYEGFWVDGVAKCGTMSDLERDEAPAPPKYPFPKIKLKDVELVLREAKSAYQDQRC